MIDIVRRPNQKDKRTKEFKEELSINTMCKLYMQVYTKELQDFLVSDTNIVPKRVLEALYLTDEGTLALTVLRSVLTMLISSEDNTVLLSSLSKIVNKSILYSKSLEQLEEEHASLNAYIDLKYQRDEGRKLKAKLRSHLKLFGETQEKYFLEESSSADAIGSILITMLAQCSDLIEVKRLSSQSTHGLIHYHKFKPFSYIVTFTDDIKEQLINLDYLAEDLIKPLILPVLKKPKKVTSWYDKSNRLVEDGRPVNLIKTPKRKQDIKKFKYVLDRTLDIKKFNDVHHNIESTAWTINEEVFRVMQEIFNNNFEDSSVSFYKNEHYSYHPYLIGGLPRRFGIEPDKLIDKSKLGQTFTTKEGRIRFVEGELQAYSRFNEIKNDMLAFNEKNLSKALSLISMFRIAEEFKGKTFYFTYQYDTRYRIYPVQNTLNPQSNSFGKALLKFSEDLEPLNAEGHYWAKIHGANVYGNDKDDLDLRASFIDKMISKGELQRIAEDPLNCVELWSNTDKPFEFLAFCIEYNKVLKNPLHLFSIPIQVDATCSGIQIYSGLLRDKKGAEAVNVIGSKRNDIYGAVADEVNRMLSVGEYERFQTHHNKNGEETETDYKPLADSLKGKINRNITKRNTMTQPYSVTMRGMQMQLLEIFNELEEKGEKYWVGENWEVARFLAKINQKAIDNIVIGASKGKDFIKYITKLVAQKNKGLLYTNPFGGVVYQENLKTQSKQIWTHIFTPQRGLEKVRFTMQEKAQRIDGFGQQSASAPNTIHTFDASLLTFTCRTGTQRGIKHWSFAHDSYGTIPNKVPLLNKTIREEFVKLFKEDVLYDWAIQVLSNGGYSYDEIVSIIDKLEDPMLNTLDLDEVHQATYMFS